MLDAITYTITLKPETCCVCGCVFGISTKQREALLESHSYFYCPNGHSQHYTGKTEEQKRIEALEKERDALKRTKEWLEKDVEFERTARKEIKAKLTATRGQLTKTKKRVANGVCPCCTRSFTNLRRHMQTQHPDFDDASTPHDSAVE